MINVDRVYTLKDFLDANKDNIDPDVYAALIGFITDALDGKDEDDSEKLMALNDWIDEVFGTDEITVDDMVIEQLPADPIDILDYYEDWLHSHQ